MNLLRFLALHCPACALLAGRAFVALGGAMLVLGLRMDRLLSKVARVFGRAGVEPPADLLAAWPWWLQLFVPESLAGYIVAAGVLVLGLLVIRAGKWAKRMG